MYIFSEDLKEVVKTLSSTVTVQVASMFSLYATRVYDFVMYVSFGDGKRSLKESFARVCLCHDLPSQVFLQRKFLIYIVGRDAIALSAMIMVKVDNVERKVKSMQLFFTTC